VYVCVCECTHRVKLEDSRGAWAYMSSYDFILYYDFNCIMTTYKNAYFMYAGTHLLGKVGG